MAAVTETAAVRLAGASNSSLIQVQAVDPAFLAATVSTLTVANAANAALTKHRLRRAERALGRVSHALDAITARRDEACLLARSVQLQVVLGDGLFTEAAARLPAPAAAVGTDLGELNKQLQAATERLALVACHDVTAPEMLVVEHGHSLQIQVQELQGRLMKDCITLVMDVITSIPTNPHTVNAVRHELRIDAVQQAVAHGLELEWNEASKIVAEDVGAALEFAHVPAAGLPKTLAKIMEQLGKHIGSIGGRVAIAASAAIEAAHELHELIEGPVYEIKPNVLVDELPAGLTVAHRVRGTTEGAFLAIEHRKGPLDAKWVHGEGRVPLAAVEMVLLETTQKVLGCVNAILEVVVQITHDKPVPGMMYTLLIMKNLQSILRLADNVIKASEEHPEELGRHAMFVENEALLTGSRQTCGAMVDVQDLAWHQAEVLEGFGAQLFPDGDAAVEFPQLLAASERFCAQYPSLCHAHRRALEKELATLAQELGGDPKKVRSVFHMAQRLAEIAPVSDLAFARDQNAANGLAALGFVPARGLEHLLVCRGCGPNAVFRLELAKSAKHLDQLQALFAQGFDGEGKGLPRSSTFHVMEYKQGVYQRLVFYRAPVVEVAAAGRQVVQEVGGTQLILTVDGEDHASRDQWTQAATASLVRAGARVLEWAAGTHDEDASIRTMQAAGLHIPVSMGQRDIFDVVHTFHSTYRGSLSAADWRDAVPKVKQETQSGPAKKDWSLPPFTHAAVLEGCGCKLLFPSQYTALRTVEELRSSKYPTALNGIRAAMVWENKDMSQRLRCGGTDPVESVAIWVASGTLGARLRLAERQQLSGPLNCRVQKEVTLFYEQDAASGVMALEQFPGQSVEDVEKEASRAFGAARACARVPVRNLLGDSNEQDDHQAAFLVLSADAVPLHPLAAAAAEGGVAVQLRAASRARSSAAARVAEDLQQAVCGDKSFCATSRHGRQLAAERALGRPGLRAVDPKLRFGNVGVLRCSQAKVEPLWHAALRGAATLPGLQRLLGGLPAQAGRLRVPTALLNLMGTSFKEDCDVFWRAQVRHGCGLGEAPVVHDGMIACRPSPVPVLDLLVGFALGGSDSFAGPGSETEWAKFEKTAQALGYHPLPGMPDDVWAAKGEPQLHGYVAEDRFLTVRVLHRIDPRVPTDMCGPSLDALPIGFARQLVSDGSDAPSLPNGGWT